MKFCFVLFYLNSPPLPSTIAWSRFHTRHDQSETPARSLQWPSPVWNFCARFSDVISRGNHWRVASRNLVSFLRLIKKGQASPLKQETIGIILIWGSAKRTTLDYPRPSPLQSRSALKNIAWQLHGTWLILSQLKFQNLLSFYAYKTWQGQLFGFKILL